MNQHISAGQPPAKRTAIEVTSTTDEIFLGRAYLHAEASGISYSAMFNLLTPTFLSARRSYHGAFPTPSHARTTHFPTSLTLTHQTVDSLISDQPFSILVDETPDMTQVSFVLVAIATPAHFCALSCKKLDPGESINAQSLCDFIRDTLNSHQLKSQNFIAYISDNCSYAKKAFKLLKDVHPNLRRIGCLSHIIHLLSKAIFSPSKGIVTWPAIDQLVSDTNTLFASRHAAAERDRQERFKLAFDVAARPLFWQVSGRWACKLRTLLWLNDHRVAFLRFVNQEIDRFNSNPALVTVRDILTQKLACTQLTLVCQLAQPLRVFLTLTQAENPELTAEIFQKYEAFIFGIEAANSPEYLVQLVNKVCNDNHFVLSHDARGLMQAQLSQSLDSVQNQHIKHLSYLSYAFKALPMLDPKNVFDSERRQMPAVLMDLCSQPLVAMGEYHELTNPDRRFIGAYRAAAQKPSMLTFWTQYTVDLPQLAATAFRLLAIRAGIAGVERQFKELRAIQLPQRQNMHNDTLEGIFLMRCNAQQVDVFKR